MKSLESLSGILRSRRDKKQSKKAAKKKKDADSLSNKDENVVECFVLHTEDLKLSSQEYPTVFHRQHGLSGF
uniref:Uncharacterized protein n=1 Tax=Megaselia scalaris TaxID=36166 RepID=T1GG55_MEGSC